MMEVDEQSGGRRRTAARPPMVTFALGPVLTFKAVAEQLTSSTRCSVPTAARSARRRSCRSSRRRRREDGSSAPGGTPAAEPDDARRSTAIGSHVVRDGDSLPSIAYARLRRPDPLADDRGGERHRRPAPAPPRRDPRDPEARRVSAAPTDRAASASRSTAARSTRSCGRARRGPRRGQPHAARLLPASGSPTRASGSSTRSRFEIGNEVEIVLGGAEATRAHAASSRARSRASSPSSSSSGAGSSSVATTTRTAPPHAQDDDVPEHDLVRHRAARSPSEAGSARPVDGRAPNPPHEFVQQNNETDWEFLWRLARLHDFEVVVQERKLHFRKARTGEVERSR